MTKSQDSSGLLGLKELIAIGVGGMIGGGIFSVLGIAAGVAGHAAPLAFLVGSALAALAGYSYARLAVTYRDDGASFTYLDRAFPDSPNVAGIAGWTVVVGYVGTLALYAFTFGAYGADLLGSPGDHQLRIILSLAVLVFFLLVNLLGTRSTGLAEDIVVYAKLALLTFLGGIGLQTVREDHLTPVFDQGGLSVLSAGALVFVAYEGFQLITNAVCESRDPERNVPIAIYTSVAIVSLIYFVLAIVGIGNLTIAELRAAEEYALADAARPVLGSAGPVLVGVAALLATSSAINATSFGASRMMAEMAQQHRAPQVFSFRSRTAVPWIAIIALMALASVFTLLGGLELIAAFSSMTFLLVSIAVSIANLRLRAKTQPKIGIVVTGIVLMTATVVLMVVELARTSQSTLTTMGAIYAAAAAAELLFSKRRLLRRPVQTP